MNDSMSAEHISPAVAPDLLLETEADLPSRILVVDDDADIRRLNGELLINAGYQVGQAEDGWAAWEELQLNGYDLLVTDNNMPRLTGVGLLQKLHAARMALPCILVTGAAPVDELARHPWLQVEAMLLKPYSADELITVVRNVLRAIDDAGGQIMPPPKMSPVRLPERHRI